MQKREKYATHSQYWREQKNDTINSDRGIWYMNEIGPYNPTISWVVSALLGSVVFLE